MGYFTNKFPCLATAMGFFNKFPILVTAMGFFISKCQRLARPPSPALAAVALEGIACSADHVVEAIEQLALEVFVEAEATVERMIQARHV